MEIHLQLLIKSRIIVKRQFHIEVASLIFFEKKPPQIQKTEFWYREMNSSWSHISRVAYQIYPTRCSSFYNNGEGIGDLRGIILQLDYLERLGVAIVCLRPVYQSPNADKKPCSLTSNQAVFTQEKFDMSWKWSSNFSMWTLKRGLRTTGVRETGNSRNWNRTCLRGKFFSAVKWSDFFAVINKILHFNNIHVTFLHYPALDENFLPIEI